MTDSKNKSLLKEPKSLKMLPLNTWDRIINQIILLRNEPDNAQRIRILVELVVNIRLLDKEQSISDARNFKDDMEKIHQRIINEIELTFESIENPSTEYIYYWRELLKKLPVRGNDRNLIDDIRSAAEFFEEGRDSDDPMLSFAGDLRKEVHRKLSPKIMSRFIDPYLELVRNSNSEPMFKAGYMALAAGFDPSEEDDQFIELAQELLEKLNYLWDYEKGDIASVKTELSSNIDLFEKCFLKKEIEAFLEISSVDYIKNTDNLIDCFKRLSSFKMLLKKSYQEKRISFFDYLKLDLGIGRLIFIFTNDLTNNHYETVTFENIQDCLLLVKEFLTLLAFKGIKPAKSDDIVQDLTDLYETTAVDIQKTKRIVQNISIELQSFMRENIFQRLNQKLNNVLEAYKVPTSALLPIKDRFFNNFIRTTEFHAVSEFIEKIITFLNRELAVASMENSLYGKYRVTDLPQVNDDYESFIATTWAKTPDSIRPYLGGKGNSIIDMSNLGVRVPPAFILGLPVCRAYFDNRTRCRAFRKALEKYLNQLEEKTKKQLGSVESPLLVSVRSGTTISLPGSMCTILNVGITRGIFNDIAEKYGKTFTQRIYLRFLKNVLTALGLEPIQQPFTKETKDELILAIAAAEEKVLQQMGPDFLDDPFEQLVGAIELVFSSSRSKKVKEYLEELSIDIECGTAVTIQQMVFGNKNKSSLSGVVFTWNPIDGREELFGEYREMTQGEDVVMGNVVTRNISTLPETFKKELFEYKTILEKEFKHELDIEFTVEDNILYLLQTRMAKVSIYAKLIIDTALAKQGVITMQQYKDRIERMCATNAFISVPRADEEQQEWNPPLGLGVPVNHGVTCGAVVLTLDKLEEIKEKHENIIYFAQSTNPSDFYAINNSNGIITVFPGRTSHAAITSITLNKPCVVGCSNAVIDLEKKTVTFKGESETTLMEGELITLDANGGYIYRGLVPLSHCFIRTHSILDSIYSASDLSQAAAGVEKILQEKMRLLEMETGQKKQSLSNIPAEIFKGKKVLVRLDLNVPFSKNKITDTARIDSSIPTIRHLVEAGATPVICSHLGDPGKQEKKGKSREEVYAEFSMEPVADYLKNHFKMPVVFHPASIASSGVLIQKEDIQPGKINILENLRFAIGEKENDSVFARGLACLSDGIFVNDAFGTCHRFHASITGVTKYCGMNIAGFLIEKELKYLGDTIFNPQRPFVGITGGSKISSKLGVIESLLQKIDLLIVGGGIGYTLLKATGFDVQNSLVEESMLNTARKLMEKYGSKIILPMDFVVTDSFDFPNRKVGQMKRDVLAIPEGWESFDLGKKSIDNAIEILETARTILWNGPIGAFEIEEGSIGTSRLSHELARLADMGKKVIIGGGDSACAVRNAGVSDRMTHVSTGGGASLEFLERRTLPGVSALDSGN